jgi:hypothetical protein
MKSDDRIQHRLRCAAAIFFVHFVIGALQIDIDGVQIRNDGIQRLFRRIAGCLPDILQPCFTGQLHRVERVFDKDDRFRVRVGDGRTSGSQSPPHMLFRADVLPINRTIRFGGLRNRPVLAPKTTQVAADCSKGVGCSAGKEMIERLLLDGVDRNRDCFPIIQCIQSPLPILPNGADSPFAFRDDAMMWTDAAPDSAVPQFFVQHSFLHFINPNHPLCKCYRLHTSYCIYALQSKI